MLRGLLKLVVVVVVLAAAAAFFLGYRIGDNPFARPAQGPVATGKVPDIDTAKARATGAAIGEKVAATANEAQKAIGEMSLQGKIKSKMALDELVKASAIDIDSDNGVVTLKGTVRSEAERVRALQLARETAGVTAVKDQLVVR